MDTKNGRFPYKHLSKYPHLVGNDGQIWDRFITRNPDRFERCDYDVHVGEGQDVAPGLDPIIAAAAKALTQRRIDVVAYKGNATTLIELKDYAGVSAIGQLLCYRELYSQDFEPSTPPALFLITNQFNSDCSSLCQKFGIEYTVV